MASRTAVSVHRRFFLPGRRVQISAYKPPCLGIGTHHSLRARESSSRPVLPFRLSSLAPLHFHHKCENKVDITLLLTRVLSDLRRGHRRLLHLCLKSYIGAIMVSRAIAGNQYLYKCHGRSILYTRYLRHDVVGLGSDSYPCDLYVAK